MKTKTFVALFKLSQYDCLDNIYKIKEYVTFKSFKLDYSLLVIKRM